jgi:hypothetical protein
VKFYAIFFLALFEEKLNKVLDWLTLAGYEAGYPVYGRIPISKKAGLSGQISGASKVLNSDENVIRIRNK